MLWQPTETHQVESLFATLQAPATPWGGITGAMLSITWSCPCGKTQAFCSTYDASIEGGAWEAAQQELTALCRALGLTEPPGLLPDFSSSCAMTWSASWKRNPR